MDIVAVVAPRFFMIFFRFSNVQGMPRMAAACYFRPLLVERSDSGMRFREEPSCFDREEERVERGVGRLMNCCSESTGSGKTTWARMGAGALGMMEHFITGWGS